MRPVFPGIGVFIAEVLAAEGVGPYCECGVGGDGLLQEIGDLLGQACERPEHAAGILDAVADRHDVLRLRVAVSEAAIAAARRLLAPEPVALLPVTLVAKALPRPGPSGVRNARGGGRRR